MIKIVPYFSSDLGTLYQGDCRDVLPKLECESVDMVFADPPFNLGKDYGDKVNDSMHPDVYISWYRQCIAACERVLKPGGSLFLYNLPKWNIMLGSFLQDRGLTFRHWIAVSLKMSMPIRGRLYPAHYSLLYYCKGARPKTFNKVRTPILTCRHCGGDVKDYGGHRKSMHSDGVNLTDVWDDISPVRHKKYKSAKRKINQLSTKLVTRVVEMSTLPGDMVLDPFGGSGTTYDVCQRTGRRWTGVEIGDCAPIVERLESGCVECHNTQDRVSRKG